MGLKNQNRKARIGITILSLSIPIIVGSLFRVKVEGVDLSFLPPIYASINALTAVLLIIALVGIKKRNLTVHQFMIQACLILSLLFLGCYVAYHMTSDSTPYQGNLGFLYYPLLISHIILSIAVVPLVLFTYLFAWEGKYKKHKKWARFTWPLWFYVAISGVTVYLMISPYYGS